MKFFTAFLFAGLVVAASSASVTPKMSYKQALRAKSIGCDVCTFIVTEIDKLLAADSTIDTIVEQVEKLCGSLEGIFPGSGSACNSLVESYLPQIIEGLVDNQLSPSSVCGLLTLCPAARKF